jgi:hypothetical protein
MAWFMGELLAPADARGRRNRSTAERSRRWRWGCRGSSGETIGAREREREYGGKREKIRREVGILRPIRFYGSIYENSWSLKQWLGLRIF